MRTHQNLWFIASALLSFVILRESSCSAFAPSLERSYVLAVRQSTVQLHAVTEEDVMQAVEKAEVLWSKALTARKSADEAAGKAEAIRAFESGGAAETSHLSEKTISLAALADGMQVKELLEEAIELSEEAERVEVKAEAALKETEKLLEHHLKDFPNSPLAGEE